MMFIKLKVAIIDLVRILIVMFLKMEKSMQNSGNKYYACILNMSVNENTMTRSSISFGIISIYNRNAV